VAHRYMDHCEFVAASTSTVVGGLSYLRVVICGGVPSGVGVNLSGGYE